MFENVLLFWSGSKYLKYLESSKGAGLNSDKKRNLQMDQYLESRRIIPYSLFMPACRQAGSLFHILLLPHNHKVFNLYLHGQHPHFHYSFFAP